MIDDREYAGHLWHFEGLEDTSTWAQRQIRWARVVNRCLRCGTVSMTLGVPIDQWAANQKRCPERKRWWHR